MALTNVEKVKTALQVGDLYDDATIEPCVNAAIDLIELYVTAVAFEDEPAALQEAATGLACDIFMARVAPGGQIVGADFQPSPWKLGRSLITRFSGLMVPYMRVEGMVG
jgi:hypothetical protein